MKCFQKSELHTCDLGREGAARNVLVVVLHQDAVVPRQSRQVRDRARPVFVIDAADLCFRRSFDSQVQPTWETRRTALL